MKGKKIDLVDVVKSRGKIMVGRTHRSMELPQKNCYETKKRSQIIETILFFPSLVAISIEEWSKN
jgi:hypothetical protein